MISEHRFWGIISHLWSFMLLKFTMFLWKITTAFALGHNNNNCYLLRNYYVPITQKRLYMLCINSLNPFCNTMKQVLALPPNFTDEYMEVQQSWVTLSRLPLVIYLEYWVDLEITLSNVEWIPKKSYLSCRLWTEKDDHFKKDGKK